MPVKQRPLFHEKTDELENLANIAVAKGDVRRLKSIRRELTFRSTARARKLARMVEEAIVAIENPLPLPVTPPEPEQSPTMRHPVLGSPLRDVVLWLDDIASRWSDDQMLRLRNRFAQHFPEFARFVRPDDPTRGVPSVPIRIFPESSDDGRFGESAVMEIEGVQYRFDEDGKQDGAYLDETLTFGVARDLGIWADLFPFPDDGAPEIADDKPVEVCHFNQPIAARMYQAQVRAARIAEQQRRLWDDD